MKKIILCTFVIAFAIKMQAQQITTLQTSNWNNLKKSGFFESTKGAINAPGNDNWYWGLNIAHTNNAATNVQQTFGAQIAFPVNTLNNGVPSMFIRSTNVGGNGLWAKVLHNQGSQTINGELNVNGNLRTNTLYLKTIKSVNDIMTSNIIYPGHFLVIGSPEGSYFHNVLSLRPGGSKDGFLYSRFEMHTTTAKGVHEQKVQIHTSGNTYFNGGLVGIGTTAPKYKLDVNGIIRAKEIKIEPKAWADYVFKKDYLLPTLKEVETHINDNGHLPGIPSESQVMKEGIDVAEMQIKLLQKIEELTLYIIEQEKDIEELKVENQKIRSQLKGSK